MKENTKASELFDEQFKFKINEEVRHKADGKDQAYSTDMGLFIVCRVIQEESDSDGNLIYQRDYHCRTIKFSGSGQLVSFSEKELLSMEEYARKQIEQREWRDNVHQEMKQIEKEIFESFGVTRGTQICLIKDGISDKENIYVISGYGTSKEGTKLNARSKYGENVKGSTIEIVSKSEFEIIIK